MIGINESKVVFLLLLDLALQVGDKAIGRHLHKESTPNSMLKVVIDENVEQFSDWHCNDSLSCMSWVERMMEGRRRDVVGSEPAELLQTQRN